MLDNKGFDLWADGYDKAAGLSDEENSYPFAGYKEVLGSIFRTIMKKPGAVVLDIGFGTGTLTSKLYEHGCTVFGQDFSERMTALAAEKMPDARLFTGDFTAGLAGPLLDQNYDFIIATYSLHHLTNEQKIPFIIMLCGLLREGGMILIGDVAFACRSELDSCRMQAGDEWDDEEQYFVFDELQEAIPKLCFTKISFCAGILTLAK